MLSPPSKSEGPGLTFCACLTAALYTLPCMWLIVQARQQVQERCLSRYSSVEALNAIGGWKRCSHFSLSLYDRARRSLRRAVQRAASEAAKAGVQLSAELEELPLLNSTRPEARCASLTTSET